MRYCLLQVVVVVDANVRDADLWLDLVDAAVVLAFLLEYKGTRCGRAAVFVDPEPSASDFAIFVVVDAYPA